MFIYVTLVAIIAYLLKLNVELKGRLDQTTIALKNVLDGTHFDDKVKEVTASFNKTISMNTIAFGKKINNDINKSLKKKI